MNLIIEKELQIHSFAVGFILPNKYFIQQAAFTALLTVSLLCFDQSGFFQILNSSSDCGRRQLYVACYCVYGGEALAVFVGSVIKVGIDGYGSVGQVHLVEECQSAHLCTSFRRFCFKSRVFLFAFFFRLLVRLICLFCGFIRLFGRSVLFFCDFFTLGLFFIG